jgi:hypothetical protein
MSTPNLVVRDTSYLQKTQIPIIPANKDQLLELIKEDPQKASLLVLRDNGTTPHNWNLIELAHVVWNIQAARALTPLVIGNPVAIAEIFENADADDGRALAQIVRVFAKQNSTVALWKWFLTERGNLPEDTDEPMTLHDLGDLTENDTRNATQILDKTNTDMLLHLSECDPSLARAIKQSMKLSTSESINAWAQRNQPKRNASSQLIIENKAWVNATLDPSTPKASDYV